MPELARNTHAYKLDIGDVNAGKYIQKVIGVLIVNATAPATNTKHIVIHTGDSGVMLYIYCWVDDGTGSKAREINARGIVQAETTTVDDDRAASFM